MENILVSKNTDDIHIYEDYYFNIVLRVNFEDSFRYFIDNNLVVNKFDEIYFKMPFNVLKKIGNSIDEGTYLNRSVYLSPSIWYSRVIIIGSFIKRKR
jgi:hypothetical protein